MTSSFEVEQLSDKHDISQFNCDQLPLNNWLKSHALRASRQGTARTVVLVPRDENRVVGYYSLAPTEVNRVGWPSKAAGGISTIPAYLLARLALDEQLHGHGLGARLLAAALNDVLSASKYISGRLLVVDAIDECALGFYQRYGFRHIPNTMRLFRLVSEIEYSKGS